MLVQPRQMSEAAVRTSDRMDGAWPVQPDCCVVESTLLCEGRRPLCDLMAPTAFVHRIVGASTSAEARKVAWADKTLWDEAFGCPSIGNFLLVSPVRVHLRALYRYLCNRTQISSMHFEAFLKYPKYRLPASHAESSRATSSLCLSVPYVAREVTA